MTNQAGSCRVSIALETGGHLVSCSRSENPTSRRVKVLATGCLYDCVSIG